MPVENTEVIVILDEEPRVYNRSTLFNKLRERFEKTLYEEVEKDVAQCPLDHLDLTSPKEEVWPPTPKEKIPCPPDSIFTPTAWETMITTPVGSIYDAFDQVDWTVSDRFAIENTTDETFAMMTSLTWEEVAGEDMVDDSLLEFIDNL